MTDDDVIAGVSLEVWATIRQASRNGSQWPRHKHRARARRRRRNAIRKHRTQLAERATAA